MFISFSRALSAPSAVSNCTTNWFLAIVALAVIIVFNIWGKGMLKIVPIILGLLISYAVGLVLYFISQANPDLIQTMPWLFSGGSVLDDAGNVTSYLPIFDFSGVQTVVNNIANGQIFGEQGLIGIPVIWNKTTFGGIDWSNGAVIASSIIAIVPISLAGRNYIQDPGLHRTLIGDGLATTLASLFGGPANTTYGENTGVLALTKVYDPRVIRIAAIFACTISFFPIVAALIGSIPSCIIGGISFVLYGTRCKHRQLPDRQRSDHTFTSCGCFNRGYRAQRDLPRQGLQVHHQRQGREKVNCIKQNGRISPAVFFRVRVSRP